MRTELYLHPESHMTQVGRLASDFLMATRVLEKTPSPLGARLKSALGAQDIAEIEQLKQEAFSCIEVTRDHMKLMKLNVQVAEKFAAAADRLNLLDEAARIIAPSHPRKHTIEGLNTLGLPAFAKLVTAAKR